jgi:hypothetical protein
MLFTLIVEQVVGEVGGERVFTVQTDLGRYCRQPKRGLASYDECSTEEGMLDVKLEGGVLRSTFPHVAQLPY